MDELETVAVAAGIKPAYSKNTLAMQLFSFAQNNAQPHPLEEEATEMEAHLKEPKKPRIYVPIPKDAKIRVLVPEGAYKAGTKRARNFAVIADCTNTAEALDRLRSLQPKPGSTFDIQLAISKGLIELYD